MTFLTGRDRTTALVACLSLAAALGAAPGAFAQAKKPTPAPAAPAGQAQPAPAQGQQAQGPIKVDLKPSQPDWTKVCGKDQGNNKEICYTTRDYSADPTQPPAIALAVYDVKGDDTRIVRLLMPVGLLLKPGFRVTVDKGPQIDGAFEICMPNGCFAETKIKGISVDQLKKGTTMSVAVKNSVNNEVDFNLPLAGFGKAFDGPAIDPKVLQAKQEELQKQLEEKAKQARQALEQQQGGVTAPVAPAPAPAK